ncbi:MAG: urease accessory protein [Nitrospinae bacterium CG22_combo_CG10-13_8_21_14_all_47_10]|nr:MAG: urease accessory protein [Nitrospinae bacterium CG22_combo_CG10-13_8_21_14_all_47_10]
MIHTLLLGFLIGLKHALEADHVAAVATLASKATIKEGLVLGATWGLGHTITLFIFGSAVLIIDTVISEQLALTLEFFVGCMLVIMGGALLKEMFEKRIHLHIHRHSNGIPHLHFHSHAQDNIEHQANPHQHNHTQPFAIRALWVGMMHGMAGSAALILLTLDSVSSIGTGILYILFFGIGSMFGMALLSMVIIIPLRYTEFTANRAYQGLQTFIGLATLFLGMMIIYETGITNRLFI